MKRTLLFVAALLSTASAVIAQDVAKPQSGKAAQQDAPPMRTRLQIQRVQSTQVQAPMATTQAETPVSVPQPAVQSAPEKTAANDGPPMRTRSTLNAAPVAAPNR